MSDYSTLRHKGHTDSESSSGMLTSTSTRPCATMKHMNPGMGARGIGSMAETDIRITKRWLKSSTTTWSGSRARASACFEGSTMTVRRDTRHWRKNIACPVTASPKSSYPSRSAPTGEAMVSRAMRNPSGSHARFGRIGLAWSCRAEAGWPRARRPILGRIRRIGERSGWGRSDTSSGIGTSSHGRTCHLLDYRVGRLMGEANDAKRRSEWDYVDSLIPTYKIGVTRAK